MKVETFGKIVFCHLDYRLILHKTNSCSSFLIFPKPNCTSWHFSTTATKAKSTISCWIFFFAALVKYKEDKEEEKKSLYHFSESAQEQMTLLIQDEF